MENVILHRVGNVKIIGVIILRRFIIVIVLMELMELKNVASLTVTF